MIHRLNARFSGVSTFRSHNKLGAFLKHICLLGLQYQSRKAGADLLNVDHCPSIWRSLRSTPLPHRRTSILALRFACVPLGADARAALPNPGMAPRKDDEYVVSIHGVRNRFGIYGAGAKLWIAASYERTLAETEGRHSQDHLRY